MNQIIRVVDRLRKSSFTRLEWLELFIIHLILFKMPFACDIKGGGWCNNVTSCLSRKKTHLGSSKLMGQQIAFSGIMNNKRPFNPGVAKYFII